MRAIARHAAFEFGSGLRNRSMLLLLYLFPLGFFLMGSALMTGVNPLFQDTLVPAMAIFALLAGTVLGLPDPIVTAREAGIYRSFKIHGVPATSILLLPGVATLIHVSLVGAIITVTGPLLFDAPVPTHLGWYVMVFLAAASAHAGIGLLIAVVSASTRATVLWSQLVFLPSVLLGGLMMPTEMIPDRLALISHLLPATHAMNAMLGLAYDRPTAMFDPLLSFIVLLIGTVSAVAAAVWLFQWDRRAETRRAHPILGLLALVPYAASLLLI